MAELDQELDGTFHLSGGGRVARQSVTFDRPGAASGGAEAKKLFHVVRHKSEVKACKLMFLTATSLGGDTVTWTLRRERSGAVVTVGTFATSTDPAALSTKSMTLTAANVVLAVGDGLSIEATTSGTTADTRGASPATGYVVEVDMDLRN